MPLAGIGEQRSGGPRAQLPPGREEVVDVDSSPGLVSLYWPQFPSRATQTKWQEKYGSPHKGQDKSSSLNTNGHLLSKLSGRLSNHSPDATYRQQDNTAHLPCEHAPRPGTSEPTDSHQAKGQQSHRGPERLQGWTEESCSGMRGCSLASVAMCLKWKGPPKAAGSPAQYSWVYRPP